MDKEIFCGFFEPQKRPPMSEWQDALSDAGVHQFGIVNTRDVEFLDEVRGYCSIEGYGIFVSKLANQAGIKYNNGERTITCLGALLYNTPESG